MTKRNDRLLPARVFSLYGFTFYTAFQEAAIQGFRDLAATWDIDFKLDAGKPLRSYKRNDSAGEIAPEA